MQLLLRGEIKMNTKCSENHLLWFLILQNHGRKRVLGINNQKNRPIGPVSHLLLEGFI